MPDTVVETAPAKLNLFLEIVGRRADGFHLLDSLVAFADRGDLVCVAADPDAAPDSASLTVGGPFAGSVPAGPANLVLRAADLLASRWPGGVGAVIRLEKHLPVAAGIGGGSADAAATLRALSRLRGIPVPAPDDPAVVRLGADLPVCLAGQAARVTGIGDVLSTAPALPAAFVVLVNPGVALATPEVFRALGWSGAATEPRPLARARIADVAALADLLRARRNDLTEAACRLAPEISEVLRALGAQPGCLLARMSGSGATVFGLFADEALAAAACGRLVADAPRWWVQACRLAAGRGVPET